VEAEAAASERRSFFLKEQAIESGNERKASVVGEREGRSVLGDGCEHATIRNSRHRGVAQW
jgi:hypothetical protein